MEREDFTDPTIFDIIRRVRPYTVVSEDRLIALAQAARGVVLRQIRGDIVECGSARGGSAAMLGWAVRNSDKRLHVYDRFVGLPVPTAEDGPDAPKYIGANRATQGDVATVVALAEFPLEYLTIHAGDFQDTIPHWPPEQIALLHVDCDWYQSVLYVLRMFYDRVSPGGIIVLDDFGFWVGCRHAFYEFCHERQLHPELHRVGEAAWWEKA